MSCSHPILHQKKRKKIGAEECNIFGPKSRVAEGDKGKKEIDNINNILRRRIGRMAEKQRGYIVIINFFFEKLRVPLSCLFY